MSLQDQAAVLKLHDATGISIRDIRKLPVVKLREYFARASAADCFNRPREMRNAMMATTSALAGLGSVAFIGGPPGYGLGGVLLGAAAKMMFTGVRQENARQGLLKDIQRDLSLSP